MRPFAALSAGAGCTQNARVRHLLVAGGLLALSACSSVSEVSEGLVLTVTAEPTAGRDADGTLTVDTDLGYQVRLSRAYLVSSSVEIYACQNLASRWGGWLIGRAEAHVLGTPTRLGTAFVEPLTGAAGASHALGEIRPPPDRYCRVSYTASAADKDAEGMPPDGVAAGNTVYLEGSYRRGDSPPQPFTVSSSSPFTVSADLTTMDLFGAGPTPTLVIRKRADHWFDGVDFQNHPARVISRSVLDNVQRSIRLERP
jgi:hypothetical protein